MINQSGQPLLFSLWLSTCLLLEGSDQLEYMHAECMHLAGASSLNDFCTNLNAVTVYALVKLVFLVLSHYIITELIWGAYPKQ